MHSIIALHGAQAVIDYIRTNGLDGFEPMVDTIKLAQINQMDGWSR